MFRTQILTSLISVTLVAPTVAQQFQLVTGVDAGLTPGTSRLVSPQSGFPGQFFDGDRLAGTAGTATESFLGSGTPLFSPNQFGSLSFMFRRGSIPAGPGNQIPIMAIDYLGGPRLDLDGDTSNATRSLVPVTGQSAVPIPGSKSFIDLSINKGAGQITLNKFDATTTNAGAAGFGADIAVTVNTLAGTLPNGQQTGAINSPIDTRQGTLMSFAPGVTRITNLGHEIWQDSLSSTTSTADTLGTLQFLGHFGGWLIERDANGTFPTLTGLGLGTTLWPAVDIGDVGSTFNTANGLAGGTATIADGASGDVFSVAGNGGLPLTDFSGDLGAYLDQVVIPAIDPLSGSFVFLESAGLGINNSLDPVFTDTNGYDLVVVAQSTPVPEPATLCLVLLAAMVLFPRTRKVRMGMES